jgi:hypothetical protein
VDLAGNGPYLVTQSSRRVLDEPHDLRIQWRTSQPFPAPTRDFKTSQRPFIDQCPFELGDCHEHPKLKLADGILLRGINPLARANQGDVPHLQFPDDDRQVRQTPPKSVEFVRHDLMDAAGPDLRQHVFKPRASRCRPRCGIPEYQG